MLRSPDRLLLTIFPLHTGKMMFRKISFLYAVDVVLLLASFGNRRATNAALHSMVVAPTTTPTASLPRTLSTSSGSGGTHCSGDSGGGSSTPRCEYTTTELERLARASSKKIRGSKTYYKAWRHWSEMAIDIIRNDLIQNLPASPTSRAAAATAVAHPRRDVKDDKNEARTTTNPKSFQRTFQLGMAADYGIMPLHLFQNAAARSDYAIDFFCRARLLGDLIMTTRNSHSRSHNNTENSDKEERKPLSSSSDFMLSEALEGLWSSSARTSSSDHDNSNCNNNNKVCRLTSIGGGPGYDFVAAALVASFRNSYEPKCAKTTTKTTPSWSIHATILDYEEGWRDLVDTMSQATIKTLRFDQNHGDSNNSKHVAIFGGKCDITKPISLTHPSSNSALLRLQQSGKEGGEAAEENCASRSTTATITTTTTLLDTTDIWTIQYCVAENARQLQASNYVFFRDLFHGAKMGAIFVITEVTHRLWPDLVDIAQSQSSLSSPLGTASCSSYDYYYQVAFQRVRRKGGYHLVLQKRALPATTTSTASSSSLLATAMPAAPFVQSVDHLALLRMFELDGEKHQKKMDKGCVRQVRKVPGAK
jgi:Putative SAM-dependent methyltransferase